MAFPRQIVAVALCAWALGLSPAATSAPPSFELTGDIRAVRAPIDFNAIFDNDNMLLLPEGRGVRLTATIRASFVTTGRFEKKPDQVRGTVAAGTVVNSYFVATTTGGVSRYIGALKFHAERIVAVISYPELTDSHAFFALDGTIYDIMAGIDLAPAGGPDIFTISTDRRELTFDFIDLGLHDSFRILTVSDPAAPRGAVPP